MTLEDYLQSIDVLAEDVLNAVEHYDSDSSQAISEFVAFYEYVTHPAKAKMVLEHSESRNAFLEEEDWQDCHICERAYHAMVSDVTKAYSKILSNIT